VGALLEMTMRPKRFYRHMNPVIARMIRELYFSRRMKQAELGRLFQIGQNSVSRIVSGQTWNP
jgi:predicted XRE-type DNA-binding protein